MAAGVQVGERLVPVPNSAGDTSANRILARAIARGTHAEVADVLAKRVPTMSQRERRHAGLRGMKAEEMGVYALRAVDPRGVVSSTTSSSLAKP